MSAAAMIIGTSSAEDAENRLVLLPFILDGDGVRSRLLVTNVSEASSQCSMDVAGSDLDTARFEDHFLVSTEGARATFELEENGGNLTWTSRGEQSLTYGYASLDCVEPVTAQVLYSSSVAGEFVSLTSMPGARKADRFQFTLMPQVGSLVLVFANDMESDASCEVTLNTPYGSDLSQASISVPAMTSVIQMADESLRIPEDYTAGAVRAVCDRELAATGFLLKGDRFTALPPVVFPMPLIGISGATAVTEGGDAIFTITADAPPARDLPILLSVGGGEGYVDAANLGEKQVILPAGRISADYVVETIDDGAHGADGTLAVSLIPSDGYVVSEAADSARVTINNDEPLPAIGIAGGPAASEGGEAGFTITASLPSATDLPISLTVSEDKGEGYVDAANLGEKQVILEAGQTAVNYVIATVDDNVHGADDTVAVRLVPSDGYVVSEAADSARVTIVNDEPLPAIGIAGGPAVSEGGEAGFTITASLPSATDLPISLTVSEDKGEGYVDAANLGEKQVILEAGQTAVNYVIATVDDNVHGADDTVAVRLVPSDGYVVSEAADSARVTIVNDEPLPAIGIAGGPAVSEGGEAGFTITASLPSATDLPISLTVSEDKGEGYVDAANLGEKQVTLGAGQTTLRYAVATVDDTDAEDGGAVKVVVHPMDGYAVSEANGSAWATINDNDEPLPVVSIAVGAGTTEGEDAIFTITTDTPSAQDLSISLTVSEDEGEGYVDVENLGEKQVILEAGQTTVTYAIATVDDADAEDGGAVTVAVNTLDGYRISKANGSARIAITDNDEPAPVFEPPVDQPPDTQPPVNPPRQVEPPSPVLTGVSYAVRPARGRRTLIGWETQPEDASLTGFGVSFDPGGAARVFNADTYYQYLQVHCENGYSGNVEITLWARKGNVELTDTVNFFCE